MKKVLTVMAVLGLAQVSVAGQKAVGLNCSGYSAQKYDGVDVKMVDNADVFDSTGLEKEFDALSKAPKTVVGKVTIGSVGSAGEAAVQITDEGVNFLGDSAQTIVEGMAALATAAAEGDVPGVPAAVGNTAAGLMYAGFSTVNGVSETVFYKFDNEDDAMALIPALSENTFGAVEDWLYQGGSGWVFGSKVFGFFNSTVKFTSQVAGGVVSGAAGVGTLMVHGFHCTFADAGETVWNGFTDEIPSAMWSDVKKLDKFLKENTTPPVEDDRIGL